MIQDKTYRETDAVSYSLLSRIDSDPHTALQERESTPSMVLGEMLEMELMYPTLFDNVFHVMENQRPTGQMGLYCDYLVQVYTEGTVQDSAEEYRNAYKASGAQRDSEAKMRERFAFEGIDYVKEKVNTRELTVVSKEDYDTAMACAMKVRETPIVQSSGLFAPILADRRVEYQVPLYWKHNGTSCKSLLDILLINDEEKVVNIVDLKFTSKNVYTFPSSYMAFKYYLQAAFYTKALEANMVKLKLTDYNIGDFYFLVVSPLNAYAMLYRVSEQDLLTGQVGGTDRHFRHVKGFVELIRDYEWHKATNQWNYKREVYVAGSLLLNELTAGETEVGHAAFAYADAAEQSDDNL